MGRFAGKSVLITGGATGIGRAAVLAFAREGAGLVIGNRNTDAGQAVVAEARKLGAKAEFRRTDVSLEADVKALVDLAVKTFGRIDVAFNNAGLEGALGVTAEQTVENFEQVMNVNVKGVWLSMKYEVPVMLKQGGGSIVNTSSIAGSVAFAKAGVYTASKHAVEGLTKAAALEYSAQGIRINAVAPAAIDTPMLDRFAADLGMTKQDFNAMHPIGRLGKSEEIADAVLYLASDQASFITGTTLAVDGGFLAR